MGPKKKAPGKKKADGPAKLSDKVGSWDQRGCAHIHIMGRTVDKPAMNSKYTLPRYLTLRLHAGPPPASRGGGCCPPAPAGAEDCRREWPPCCIHGAQSHSPTCPMPVQASEARECEQHWRELAQTAEARLLEEKKLTMAICSDMTRQAKVEIYLSQASGQHHPTQGRQRGS